MDQSFSDGLGNITVIGNTVRLDFVSFSPVEKDAKGQPRAIFSQRIVMDMDGFLRTAAKVQESVKTLAQLAQKAKATAAPAQTAAAAEKPAAKPASSKTQAKRPFP